MTILNLPLYVLCPDYCYRFVFMRDKIPRKDNLEIAFSRLGSRFEVQEVVRKINNFLLNNKTTL